MPHYQLQLPEVSMYDIRPGDFIQTNDGKIIKVKKVEMATIHPTKEFVGLSLRGEDESIYGSNNISHCFRAQGSSSQEKYTTQQAKKINKTSVKLARQLSEVLQTYLKIDVNVAREYNKSVVKLPYVDESGNLTYLDPLELIIKHDISGISPRLARAIARHRPEIEAILAGK